ncbi:unnamed protein product, partial [Polarella glacialis]
MAQVLAAGNHSLGAARQRGASVMLPACTRATDLFLGHRWLAARSQRELWPAVSELEVKMLEQVILAHGSLGQRFAESAIFGEGGVVFEALQKSPRISTEWSYHALGVIL